MKGDASMIVLYILIAVIGLCASPYIYLFLGRITRPLSALFIACAEVVRGEQDDLFMHTNREIFTHTYYKVMNVLNNEDDKLSKFAWPLILVFHFGGLLVFAIARLWTIIATRVIIIFYRIKASSKNKDSKKDLRQIRK